MADFVRAQIAPKNNCHIVGVNLKTEHNVENTVAVRKGPERIFESGPANKKLFFLFFDNLSARVEQDSAPSMRKMANQQNLNPYIIKSTVIIDLGLESFVRTLRLLFSVVLKSKTLPKYKEIMPKSRCILLM